MGFLGLIPADKLAASYDPEHKVLTLYAEGKVKKYTTGIHFVRDPHFVGGLKFELEGWTGPIGPGWQLYKYEEKFPITFPSIITSGKDVMIATANYSGGHVVTVNWLGYAGDTSALNPNVGDLSISDGEIPKQPPVTMNGPNDIVVLWGKPFDIAAGAESNKYASCTVKYDNKYLLMTNAANEDGLIVWTFDPISIGTTQVVVTIIPPPPRLGIYQIWYTIEILGRETATIPKSLTDGSEPGAPADYLSFLGRVFIATRLVKMSWPDAELWWVEANLPGGVRPPTADPNDLSQLRAAFNVKKGTVMIDSRGWGSWDQPVSYEHKLFGNVVVPFPIKMDIVEAYKILVEKGYVGKLSSCVLKHPLGPKGEPWDEQPYYVFQLFEGPEVFVGVDNRSIWPPLMQ